MCSSFWGPTCSSPSGIWGPARALAFLVLGYLISWAAELASIHCGFPFGEYLYIPATVEPGTLGGRGALHGFPVLCLSGLCQLYPLALLALTPGRWEGRRFSLEGEAALKGSWRPVVLGAVLMVTLDIVIDPLALRGYRWFLGQIYGYPEPGVYFGVHLQAFRRLVSGVLRAHRDLAAYYYPGARVSPVGLGPAPLPPRPFWVPSLPGHPGLQPDHDLSHRGNLPGLGGDIHLPALPELAGSPAHARQPAIKAPGPSRPGPAGVRRRGSGARGQRGPEAFLRRRPAT